MDVGNFHAAVFLTPAIIGLFADTQMTIIEAVREFGISEQTYYRWRKEYGGMEVSQARRLKDLEQENGRLKRLVADQALDISILKEVSTGNF